MNIDDKSHPHPVSDEVVVYQGKVIEVVTQQMEANDRSFEIEFARRSPGTRLIIVKEDKILLTKEFRSELNDWDYRLPGGKVFDKLAEYNEFLSTGSDITPIAEEAAKREASQEAGIKVEEINLFAVSKAGATVVWDLFYFIVEGFSEAEQELEHGENIEVNWVTLEEAKDICLNGKMQEDRSVGILLRYLLRK